MPTINLSSGTAKLSVHHGTFEVVDADTDEVVDFRRGTRVVLTDGETEVDAFSMCKPPDVFSKREGRRRAATRLLRKLRDNGYNRVDRKTVFQAICPEFPQSPEERRECVRRKREKLLARLVSLTQRE